MKSDTKILVTGASGFIGTALSSFLLSRYQEVRCCSRHPSGSPLFIQSPDLSSAADWMPLLFDIDVVVHLAGKAHNLTERPDLALIGFKQINLYGTMNLARQALNARVKRFIFISSIGVNGAYTADQPFTEKSEPAPHAPYAESKYDAELALRQMFESSSTELVIIRPPLVYGPGAPGNFRRLLRWIRSGVPLPFASVENRRHMVSLINLVSFIDLCIKHPLAPNNLFLIADDEAVSTRSLIRYLAEGMEIKPHLLPVPPFLLSLAFGVIRRRRIFHQLCKSMLIDTTKAKEVLGWRPVVKASEALVESSRNFVS